MEDFARYHSPTRANILIWVKTYPQLSVSYRETVCTGGTLEDGRPVRLYPISHRYLTTGEQFKKYQWINAEIWKSTNDTRPESYRINYRTIRSGDFIEADRYWKERERLVFRSHDWQFSGMNELKRANETKGCSIGFVRPREVVEIVLVKNRMSEADFIAKFEKMEAKHSQSDVFDDNPRDILRLDYVSDQFKIRWYCHDADCRGHFTLLFDWEAYELRRKYDGETVIESLMSMLDPTRNDVGFFLGNTLDHQASFSIGGIWRPMREALNPQQSLF